MALPFPRNHVTAHLRTQTQPLLFFGHGCASARITPTYGARCRSSNGILNPQVFGFCGSFWCICRILGMQRPPSFPIGEYVWILQYDCCYCTSPMDIYKLASMLAKMSLCLYLLDKAAQCTKNPRFSITFSHSCSIWRHVHYHHTACTTLFPDDTRDMKWEAHRETFARSDGPGKNGTSLVHVQSKNCKIQNTCPTLPNRSLPCFVPNQRTIRAVDE